MMTAAVLLPPGSSADSVFYLQPSPAVSRPSAGTIVKIISNSISISMTYMITTQQYLAELYCFSALACVSPTLLSSKLEICHFFDFGIYIRSGIGDCSLALTVIMASFQLLENFYICQKI